MLSCGFVAVCYYGKYTMNWLFKQAPCDHLRKNSGNILYTLTPSLT